MSRLGGIRYSMNQTPFKRSLPLVALTTDGAAVPNPGQGAWACVLRYGNAYKEISGRSDGETTNNLMELTAVVEGLKALTKPCRVIVRTDSKIAIAWARRGYFDRKKKRREKLPRAAALADSMKPLLDMHKVSFAWVRGHAGDLDNERCDQLAAAALSHATE